MEKYLHALNLILWQNYHDFVKLLRNFSDLKYLWEKATASHFKKIAISDSAIELLLELRPKINPDQESEKLARKDINLLTIIDEKYPKHLRDISTPPLILYWQGTWPKNWKKSLSVVGTRRPSGYGKIITEKFVQTLLQHKFLIVSGLAMGIDSIAHQYCVQNKAPTIAVLGTGLHNIYPRLNLHLARHILATGGAIISEFPPDTVGYASNFPRRNRIISGLTRGTLVVEGKEHSGSLITARFALEQGKEIFAIPGDIMREQSQAPHHLIQKSGAHLVSSPENILEILNIPYQSKIPITNQLQLSSPEEIIFTRIAPMPITTDELIQSTKLPTQQVQATLSLLELKGLIKKDGDKFYAPLR